MASATSTMAFARWGELVQIDGCDHEWFEARAERCTALVYVDDATGRLMELRFIESESAFDYFATTESYLNHHDKPVAYYSDKHTPRGTVSRVRRQTPALVYNQRRRYAGTRR